MALLCSLVILLVSRSYVTAAAAVLQQEDVAATATPTTPASPKFAEIKALTDSGLQHYYSMEYEDAERDFRRALQLEPEDAKTINHLLNTVLFEALNHAGALNTSLYASDGFLALKKQAAIDPRVAADIKRLDERALELSNQRLAKNPDDEAALYDRGVTRGLFATYQALVEHAWFAALRSAMAARHDHQRVLELDPKNEDAKMIVGMHTYIAGSLPWGVKLAASLVGFSGNKERGLRLLKEAAEANGESSVDAKVALALFLRRQQRYDEALDVVRTLTATYPKNFLFALEEANLLKDMGRNDDALGSFEALISAGHTGRFHEPRLEFAYYGLGEMFRGRKHYGEAAEAFDDALKLPKLDGDIRQRCALSAGEMHDMLNDRTEAMKEYQLAMAGDTNTPTAQLARRYLREPYKAQ
jgi:tetratricopeptide (TPR) repeat protein